MEEYAQASGVSIRAEHPRSGEVDNLATRLAVETNELHERLNVLTERLRMVLRPEGPTTLSPAPSNDRDMCSPLADQMMDTVANLNKATRSVDDLISRVDL